MRNNEQAAGRQPEILDMKAATHSGQIRAGIDPYAGAPEAMDLKRRRQVEFNF